MGDGECVRGSRPDLGVEVPHEQHAQRGNLRFNLAAFDGDEPTGDLRTVGAGCIAVLARELLGSGEG